MFWNNVCAEVSATNDDIINIVCKTCCIVIGTDKNVFFKYSKSETMISKNLPKTISHKISK